MDRRATLSLNEWAVLGVLAGGARHGYDIARELRPEADLGSIWRVSRQLVYRALDRLEGLGLVEPRRTEPGEAAPPRTVYGATRAGRRKLLAWLDEPVTHLRDVRGELLLKLVLLDRMARPTHRLVEAQIDAFAPLLAERSSVSGTDDVATAWRRHSATAVASFLDELARRPSPPAS